jgi:hypothetical protein
MADNRVKNETVPGACAVKSQYSPPAKKELAGNLNFSILIGSSVYDNKYTQLKKKFTQ